MLEAANRDGVLFPVELKRITDVMELLDILDELNKIDNLEKKIIVDLPSNDIEDFLDKQVTYCHLLTNFNTFNNSKVSETV